MTDVFNDLSVVIITLNEEKNLATCLSSLPSGCEIIVLDSHSTDQTEMIAKSHGALVFQRPFQDYADQKNAAISYASRKWILSLDADEFLSPTLCRDLSQFLASPAGTDPHAAYRLRRRLIFMNQVMRFGKTADRPLRLFPNHRGLFVGKIHEQLETDLPVRHFRTQGVLLHKSYQDLADYFLRFNNYTSRIARNHFEKETSVSFIPHVLRPIFEFLGRYIFRFGFLDGYAGYTYALVSSLYSYIKYSKLIEMRSHESGVTQKGSHS